MEGKKFRHGAMAALALSLVTPEINLVPLVMDIETQSLTGTTFRAGVAVGNKIYTIELPKYPSYQTVLSPQVKKFTFAGISPLEEYFGI